MTTRNRYCCTVGCSTETERQVESNLFTDLWLLSPVVFQLYHVESYVSPLILKQYLRYSSQEQNEPYSHWWSNEKSTHKSHRLWGNLTWMGKTRRQMSSGRGSICETGSACIGCKASGALGGGGQQSAISSQGFETLYKPSLTLAVLNTPWTLTKPAWGLALLHSEALGTLLAVVWVDQQRLDWVTTSESRSYYPHCLTGDAITQRG